MLKQKFEIKMVYYGTLAVFCAFLFFPVGNLLLKSLYAQQGIGMDHYVRILSNPVFLGAMGNSFLISGVTALLTTLLAFGIAYTLHYTRIHSQVKTLMRTLIIMPMFLPSITYGFAIIYSFGKQGLLTKLFGGQLLEIYGFWGLLTAYVIYTLPPAFLLLNNAFGYMDKNFITVSALMGDSGFRTFINTSVRPLIGNLAAAFILVFFLSFTDFGIPASIGGEYHVVAIHLYNQMLGAIPDFRGGAVIAVFMLLPSVLSIAILHYLERFNFRYHKISAYEIAPNPWRDGILCTFTAIVLLSMLGIFAVMFIVPFVKSWPYQITFTFDTFRRICASSEILTIYLRSLGVAAVTAILGTVVCYGAALVNARSNLSKSSKLAMDALAMLTNTIPGMVLGIAFLFSFSGTIFQNTFFILVLANILHFFSTPYLMIKASLSRMNGSWETTGALMGDTWLKTMVQVVIPNSLSTVYEMLSYFFINAMVTISAVVFITGARTMVMTTKIKELQHYEKFDEIFVLSLLIFFTNIAVKVGFDYLAQNKEIGIIKGIRNLVKIKERTNEKYS